MFHSGGKQGWRGRAGKVRPACGDHERRDVPPLRPEGRAGREDPLGETAPSSALGPEAALAPDHAMTERLLGGVVRGFDALDTHEGPEGGLVLEELAAGPRDLGVGTCGPLLQERTNGPHDGPHLLLEGAAAHGLVPRSVPELEERPHLGKQLGPKSVRSLVAQEELLEATLQMSPAELTAGIGPVVVRGEPIRNEDAGGSDEAPSELFRSPVGDQEDCDGGRHDRPEVSLPLAFGPARLVSVFDRLLLSVGERFGVRRRERLAHGPLALRHGTERDRDSEGVAEEILDAALAEPGSPREQPDERLEARAEVAARDALGEPCRGHLPTVARDGEESPFDGLGLRLGKLGHLVLVEEPAVAGQRLAAPAALLGPHVLEAVDFLLRQRHAVLGLVSRLSASLAPFAARLRRPCWRLVTLAIVLGLCGCGRLDLAASAPHLAPEVAILVRELPHLALEPAVAGTEPAVLGLELADAGAKLSTLGLELADATLELYRSQQEPLDVSLECFDPRAPSHLRRTYKRNANAKRPRLVISRVAAIVGEPNTAATSSTFGKLMIKRPIEGLNGYRSAPSRARGKTARSGDCSRDRTRSQSPR